MSKEAAFQHVCHNVFRNKVFDMADFAKLLTWLAVTCNDTCIENFSWLPGILCRDICMDSCREICRNRNPGAIIICDDLLEREI